MGTVGVRPADGADADAVTAVFLASRAAAMPWLPSPHTDAETRWWVEHVVLAECRVWVATEPDGGVMGFAALRDAVLEHLYLHPDRRGAGTGTLLLRRAQQASPTGLTLHVFARNTAARAFYEHHGLRLVAATDGSGNEEHEPDLELRWSP